MINTVVRIGIKKKPLLIKAGEGCETKDFE